MYFTELKMPVIVIVAEGDIHTIKLVEQVLKSSIPVLVLKGSGKAADLIAGCLSEKEYIYFIFIASFVHAFTHTF